MKVFSNTLVVVSAMGKMTNAFEKVVHSYLYEAESLIRDIDFIKAYHLEITKGLFEKTHPIFDDVNTLFNNLNHFLIQKHL